MRPDEQLPPIALTARDAANVYLESDRAPANIVSVSIVDAAALDIDEAAVISWLRDRLDCSPIFRRKLQRAFADVIYPSWVADPAFDAGNHVTVVHASDWAGAEPVIQSLVASRMDLSRPPWDLTVIGGIRGLGDGLPDRATALVFRFHHSIGDAVVTAATVRRMLTATPEPAPVPPSSARRNPLVSVLRAPLDLAMYVRAIVTAPKLTQAAAAGDSNPAGLDPVVTRFNRRLEGVPTVGLVHFGLDDIRAVRAAVEGATVNDVVLTVVSGALSSLLTRLDGPVNGPLVATMPIAVNDGAGTANKFALGCVNLHADVDDPVERLRQIHATTAAEKVRQQHPALAEHRSLPNSIPAYVTRIVGWKSRRSTAAPPASHVTMISNVPSRMTDATFMGAPVVDRFGFPTLSDGGGLAHGVSSIEPILALTFTADSAALPDAAEYEALLRESFAELASKAANSLRGERESSS
ncbi:wax ester/triacylglycerol synthase domain-containing protein [Rhodococcus sp. NPDC059234]|uniref:wax ester/triacylglycerol synthase domain-containing protein n=1 Tax=Rhodococcus sp. NPDC059234 TaxID=3346781 RepID=UPI00366FDBA8